jgi:hypothetical protein
MWSRHWRLKVPTNLSANAFARGDRTGVLPVGLQLASRYRTDDRLLSIAGAVARVLLPEPPLVVGVRIHVQGWVQVIVQRLRCVAAASTSASAVRSACTVRSTIGHHPRHSPSYT